MQWGPPWWFNDHEGGMRRQLDDLAEIGQLAGFIGMLTDSRSILSMTRHELFRRVLCDVIGDDVDAGRIPDDRDWCSTVVRGICVDNALRLLLVAGLVGSVMSAEGIACAQRGLFPATRTVGSSHRRRPRNRPRTCRVLDGTERSLSSTATRQSLGRPPDARQSA